mgnify:CR=1 FL=1
MLQGTWALVIIHTNYPDQIWLTRNGSPLLLGLDENFVLVVSEQLAFNNSIKSYVIIENQDIICIKQTNGKIQFNERIERYTIQKKKKYARALLIYFVESTRTFYHIIIYINIIILF